MSLETDFLIIGSGIAGLSFANKAAELGRVVIVTKKQKKDTSTNLAQGGIATVMGKDDSFDLHIKDTLKSGDGLCHEDIVEMVVKEGPNALDELIAFGTRFNKSEVDGEEFDLGREGGHSKRRIIHAGDITGQEIESVLLAKAEAHPNIQILENSLSIDLIIESHSMWRGDVLWERDSKCWGAYILDEESKKVVSVIAHHTILSTGGCGKVYLYTSNPDIATGDGIAMAYRAGSSVSNLEFVQFHPTVLYHPNAKNFLISEAVRGEGGILIDRHGNPFMGNYHPLKDLACRDVVARAIDSELKNSGDDSVFLDISHKDADFLKRRFPNIYNKCLSFGIDITKEPIPVVPAAHYMCGGVSTDEWGRTDIDQLYAIGETACTGLHGANRLASNSLLEAVVFAKRVFIKCSEEFEKRSKDPMPVVSGWISDKNKSGHRQCGTNNEFVLIAHDWDVIRRIMWNYVGIVRSNRRLKLALAHLSHIREEIEEHYNDAFLQRDMVELRNLALLAELIVSSALSRKESRGLNFNVDYPVRDDEKYNKDTLLRLK